MTQQILQPYPAAWAGIENDTKQSGFTMSDPLTCSLLRTLAASKPGGKFLEIGTGTGLSTAWILDGMDDDSILISVDNDAAFQKIAERNLGFDKRLRLICADGGEWLSANMLIKFDYIFADSWHGKYLLLNAALQMLNKGGLYIIDDMLPQPNWPEGHAEKAAALVDELEKKEGLFITKQNWATGIIIAVKK